MRDEVAVAGLPGADTSFSLQFDGSQPSLCMSIEGRTVRRRRVFAIVCLISSVCLVASLFVVPVLKPDPCKQRLSITDGFRVGLMQHLGGEVGSITFFNDPYGPYCGSIISFSDGKGNEVFADGSVGRTDRRLCWHIGPYGVLSRRVVNSSRAVIFRQKCCDMPGVYFRYFRWTHETSWTLTVSMWYAVALFACPPALWAILRLKKGMRKSAATEASQSAI